MPEDFESIAEINQANHANEFVSDEDREVYKRLGIELDLESAEGLEAVEEVFEELDVDHRVTLVALDNFDGRIVGTITASGPANLKTLFRGAQTELPNASCMLIHSAAVHPDWQGKGCVDAMLPEVESYARRHEIPYVAAEAEEASRKSVEVFERLGYAMAKNKQKPGFLVLYKKVA